MVASIPSAATNNTSPAPMTAAQYSHIRAHLDEAARKYGGIDYVSPTFGLVRDAMAEVDRLRAALKDAADQVAERDDEIGNLAAHPSRAEVIAERDAQIIAWLVKKAREEGASNKESRTKADAIFRLADKLSRGAVR